LGQISKIATRSISYREKIPAEENKKSSIKENKEKSKEKNKVIHIKENIR